MRRRLAFLAWAAVMAASPARAQLVVHDPAVYAQSLVQAARALDQVQNQLASLQNEARNLLPLGLKAAGALNGDLARVNGLLTQASRLAADVEALRRQYEREYGAPAAGASGRSLVEAADLRWRNSADALRRALEVQAGVTAGLAATNSQAARLAEASEGASGALQAAQAGNQLLAVQSKQLADLSALLAAAGQATALEQARAAAAAAEARARLGRFLARPR